LALRRDVDIAVTELRDAGVRVVAEPTDQPWGERVASVADPDGYTVHLWRRAADAVPTPKSAEWSSASSGRVSSSRRERIGAHEFRRPGGLSVADPPQRGDLAEEITREMQRLFPAERMQRIVERLRIEGNEADIEFLADLISAVFTRGIEFGAVEVTAQEIEAGRELNSEINVVHVDLP